MKTTLPWIPPSGMALAAAIWFGAVPVLGAAETSGVLVVSVTVTAACRVEVGTTGDPAVVCGGGRPAVRTQVLDEQPKGPAPKILPDKPDGRRAGPRYVVLEF
jgi:hypothetical protein